MSTPTALRLLGLAEQLSVLEVSLGDPADDALLRELLDRCADAIVDVAQGRKTLSRPAPSPMSTTPNGAGETTTPSGAGEAPRPDSARSSREVIDAVSCSALAARCHHAAHLLGEHPDQVLARPVAESLRSVADSLQRLVQDLPDQAPSVARQRLLRGLRRGAALLDLAAPKVAP